ncbi:MULTISPECIES: hypothetical protein [unclassified Sporolactobacillus]|uniref:hypothetical protein n=1 Tax=unclassified Sporolactobacillus TaxID=2628533 RepID=UPI0023681C1E|nr:hypothetical protein [Sporolactobacillus sp. CQH2019]MDD9149486.1 hypothetical protein [Sporolactobacillus sp. CQH2019]
MKSGLYAVILTAGIAGFSAGVAVEKFKNGGHRLLSSEKVLHLVRKAAKESLSVDGAWIYLSPQTLTRDALTSRVYRGGLTVAEEKTVGHYDFLADAHTGTLLELKKQN